MNAIVEKTNGVKLFALVAVLAMIVAGAAVVMSDSAEAADGEKTYLSGSITSTQNYGNGTDVVVNGDLTIPAGMMMTISGTGKLTVESGATITIVAGGQLVFETTESGTPTITINGNIIAEGTAGEDYSDIEDAATYVGAIVNDTVYNATNKTGVTLAGTITLERGAELIASEEPNGQIILADGAAINVTKRSSNISVIENQDLYLNTGATFDLNGNATDVNIYATGSASYYTAGAASITNVNEYAQDSRVTSDVTFTVTTQTASVFVGNSAEAQKVTIRQYVLNIDGTVDGVYADGTHTYDKLTVNPGSSYSKDADSVTYYTVNADDEPGTPISPMSSVTGSLRVTGNAMIDVADNAYLAVSGTVNVDYNKDNANFDGILLDGTANISGTVSIDGNSIAPSSGLLYVDGGAITITNFSTANNPYVYGAYYLVQQDDNSDTAYVGDFNQTLVDAAVAAEADEVIVCSYIDAENYTYTVDTEVAVPEGITLAIGTQITVAEGITLTFAEGADFDEIYAMMGGYRIVVEGKLVDNGGIFDSSSDRAKIDYEVMKISEDELTTTYTTLKVALDEDVPGEVIELNGAVTIEEDMTIDADVTVVTDAEGSLSIIGATLTINGTLEIAGQDKIVSVQDKDDEKGAIVLNNIIKNADTNTFGDYQVAGAYFTADLDDTEPAEYITSVAVAAENSALVEEPAVININGDINFGDVTFTKGENADSLTIIINGAKVNAGTITLVNAGLSLTNPAGEFTGTVTSDVTAGTVTLDLVKVAGLDIAIASADDGETITTTVEISGDDAYTQGVYKVVTGEITISSGAVTVAEDIITTSYDNEVSGKLLVASGAELIVDKDVALYAGYNVNADINENMTATEMFVEYSTVTVEGTITVNGTVYGYIAVDGAMNVAEDARIDLEYAVINGTVTIADKANAEIYGIVYGSIIGEFTIPNWTIDSEIYYEILIAYPGADLSAAVINDNDGDGESDVDSTVFYLNGTEAFTAYSDENNDNGYIGMLAYMDGTGYIIESAAFYEDAGMTLPLGSYAEGCDGVIGEYENVYVAMDPDSAVGTISQGTGLSLYIDDISLSSYLSEQGKYQLTVGTHTVRYDVRAGYDASNATITFNGQTVQNGGTITITADMMQDGFTLVASGAVPSQGQVVIDQGSDDGMGITDYLLIILVVLVIILAVIVALRMMRS